MNDRISDKHLQEIADSPEGTLIGSFTKSLAAELLAARQRIAVLERVREAAAEAENCAIRCRYSDERMVWLPVLEKLRAVLDAAKEES